MKKALAALAVATGFVSLTVAAPTANATPLDDQNAIITRDRAKYGPACPRLTFNPLLEEMAQRKAGNRGTGYRPDDLSAKYNGEIRAFAGEGDPQAAALTDTYQQGAGAMLNVCEYTEFGSGFSRIEDPFARDFVGIVFGKPGPPPPVVVPPPVPVTVPDPVAVPDPVKPAPVEAPVPLATVISDVDLYDSRGFDGNVIGVLRVGEKYQLGSCIDDSCEVKGKGFAAEEFFQKP